jgi:predicted dehydrogenase
MATEGMNYAPQGKPRPVCEPGDFVFAAVGLDHLHIYGMCNGLTEAGGQLSLVYDPDPKKVQNLISRHPGARAAESEQQVLDDPAVQLVAISAVPADRADIGLRALEHGKDCFVDKPALTSLQQLAVLKEAVERTGRQYAVYYSERLHVESAVFAGQLVEQNAIGRVVQVLGLGPHRLSAASRPAWHFERGRTGGILCDIGSHQIEQFLFYTGADDAEISASRVANYSQKEYETFEDYGDCSLVADNGATGYFRVDWLTPDGLGSWGDGRTFLLGTEGYIELRKYIDVGRDVAGDQVYLVNRDAEQRFSVRGEVGYPYFGLLILDCLNRTEEAMTQRHTFKAAELAVKAQLQAQHIEQ